MYIVLLNLMFQNFNVFSSIEGVIGGYYDDRLIAGNGNEVLEGGYENDVLEGRSGLDQLFGGYNNDILIGGAGANVHDGGNGARDRVHYTDSASVRVDPQVSSTNTGFAAGDTYVGIKDIYGSFQSDTLLGNGSRNIIRGASSNDVIDGRLGNDTLVAGAGIDTRTGGTGADVFVFETALGATTVNRVLDISVADDVIHPENAIFSALGMPGELAGTAFIIGATASAPTHRIIYKRTNGQLLYDADRNGAGAAVLFATLHPVWP